MAGKGYKWQTTPNYWAAAVVALCVVAYGTRMLPQNIFIMIIAVMALARGFQELETAA